MVHQWFAHTYRVTAVYTFPDPRDYAVEPGSDWSLRLIVPIPSTDEFHAVDKLRAEGGRATFFRDGFNRFLAYSFDALPASITVEYDVTTPDSSFDLSTLAEIPEYDRSGPEYKAYIGRTSGSVMPDHPEVAAIAARLLAESSGRLDYIRRAFRFMRTDMDYGLTGEYSLDGIFALGRDGRPTGDCGAYAILYVSLLRRGGIPSRLVNGWMVLPDLSLVGHVWSEFYVEGIGWIPSDPAMGERYFSRLGPEWLHMNRGESITGEIGDWTSAWSNGRQVESYEIACGGKAPEGAFAIRREMRAVALELPDLAGYYEEPRRVDALRDRIVAGIGVGLAGSGSIPPRRSRELEEAAGMMLRSGGLGYEEALRLSGFSYMPPLWLLELRVPAAYGEDPAQALLAVLEEQGYCRRLLCRPLIGIGYGFEDGAHRYSFVSTDGKPSGEISIRLAGTSFGPDQPFRVSVDARGVEFGPEDWIGLYEAGITPDGDPKAIWWEFIADLPRGSDGSFVFDPSAIDPERRARYAAGRAYTFVIAFFDGYRVEAQASFSLSPE